MDNNRLAMENYLLVIKSTVEVYVHGTLESSNSDIKQLLKDILNETLTHQEDTYNMMSKYGWYQTNNVDTDTIKQTLNKLQNN